MIPVLKYDAIVKPLLFSNLVVYNINMRRQLLVILLVMILGCKQSEPEFLPWNLERIESVDFEGLSPYLKSDDKVYVINFWATWCKPCVAELPEFEKIGSTYKEKNVEVVLVSLDMQRQLEKTVVPFLNENKIRSKVIHLNDPNQNEWIPKIDMHWDGSIPATLIRSGDQSVFLAKKLSYEELEQAVEKMLASNE